MMFEKVEVQENLVEYFWDRGGILLFGSAPPGLLIVNFESLAVLCKQKQITLAWKVLWLIA